MKARLLAYMFLFLLITTCVKADIFDQVANESRTNKPSNHGYDILEPEKSTTNQAAGQPPKQGFVAPPGDVEFIPDNGQLSQPADTTQKWQAYFAELDRIEVIWTKEKVTTDSDFVTVEPVFNKFAQLGAIDFYSQNHHLPNPDEARQILDKAYADAKTEAMRLKTQSPEGQKGCGTGFFITDEGYLITNYHVVKGAAKVRLLTSTGLIDASVVRVDTANDLALLKANVIPRGESALPIVSSRTVNLGATVATVGFPDIGLQGYSPKLAKGEIASLSGAGDDPRYFQISVPVQPGNSGGALVDEHGNVVGIVAAKLSAQAALDASGQLPENVNYAVKSSLLLSFLESVPEVSAKLKAPITGEQKFNDVVQTAQPASVLVLVY